MEHAMINLMIQLYFWCTLSCQFLSEKMFSSTNIFAVAAISIHNTSRIYVPKNVKLQNWQNVIFIY